MLIARAHQTTNVFLIDAQHTDIVDSIEHLRSKLSRGDCGDETLQVFAALISYAQYHCRSEEWLMQVHAYPQFESHAAVHRDLIDHMEELREGVEAGTRSLRLEEINDMEAELIQHFESSDRSLGVYLNCRGVF